MEEEEDETIEEVEAAEDEATAIASPALMTVDGFMGEGEEKSERCFGDEEWTE